MIHLTTDENAAEMEQRDLLSARDMIASIIASQMGTFGGSATVSNLLRSALGDVGYDRLVRDIANNLVQGLL